MGPISPHFDRHTQAWVAPLPLLQHRAWIEDQAARKGASGCPGERGAKFGNPEMPFGFPAAMNTVLLARHFGRRKALEIAITGATYQNGQSGPLFEPKKTWQIGYTDGSNSS